MSVTVPKELTINEQKRDGASKTKTKARDIEDKDGIITTREFHKAMSKIKNRKMMGWTPKKAPSAYIIFGKEVHFLSSY